MRMCSGVCVSSGSQQQQQQQQQRDGAEYSGHTEHGLKHGTGTYTWPNRESYEGSFYKDYRHGCGTYTWSDGSRFTGKFYLNRKEGYGIHLFPDGTQFQGLYHADERFGPGVVTYPDGQQDVGVWYKQWLIRLCSCVEGAFTFQDLPDYISKHPQQNHFTQSQSELLSSPPLTVGPGMENREVCWVDTSLFDYASLLQDEKFLFSPELEHYSTDSDHLPVSWRLRGELDRRFFGRDDVYMLPVSEDSSLQQKMEAHIHRHRFDAEDLDWDVNAMLTLDRSEFGPKGPLELASERLIREACYGNLQNVSYMLLEGKVHPDVVDASGLTALMAATVNCHNDVIHMLLDSGANVNKLNNEGMSALAVCTALYYPPQYLRETLAEGISDKYYAEIEMQAGERGSREEEEEVEEESVTTSESAISVEQTPPSKEFCSDEMLEAPEQLEEGMSPSRDDVLSPVLEEEEEAVVSQVTSIQASYEENIGCQGEDEEEQLFPDLGTAEQGVEEERDVRSPRPEEIPPSEEFVGAEKPDEEEILEIGCSQKSEQKDLSFPQTSDEESADASLEEETEEEVSAATDHGTSDGESERTLDETERSSGSDFLSSIIDENVEFWFQPDQVEPADEQENVPATALVKIDRDSYWATMQLLLERGADPNASCIPMPVIILAIKAAHVEGVRQLLEYGARTDLPLPAERNGLYPIHVAAGMFGSEGPKITELLLNALTDPDVKAQDADQVYELDKNTVEPPVEFGHLLPTSCPYVAPTEVPEKGGRTALHIACQRDCDYTNARDVVSILLSHKASTKHLWSGHSALSLAIASGNDLAVDELLAGRADPNLPLSRGVGSALCAAISINYDVRPEPRNKLKMVEKLIKAGANILMPVLVGKGQRWAVGTAVDYAFYAFNQDRKIFHTSYHALNQRERQMYTAHRQLLSMMGELLRQAAIRMELQHWEENEGARAEEVHPVVRRRTADIVPHKRAMSLDRANLQPVRRPLFRYCYQCGRSAWVELSACGRCHKVFFCSKTCKVKACKEHHKQECVSVSESRGRGRLSSSAQRWLLPGKQPDFPFKLDQPGLSKTTVHFHHPKQNYSFI